MGAKTLGIFILLISVIKLKKTDCIQKISGFTTNSPAQVSLFNTFLKNQSLCAIQAYCC